MHLLKNKRILITGGAGFVGSHILDQLLEIDVKHVVLIDNMVRGSLRNIESVINSDKVTFVEGNIKDRDLLDTHMSGIDYCFHMAAVRINFCSIDPREGLETMATGTFNVIEACLKHNVKKLVAASSASIYGMADTFPTHESHHPYNNRTFYGALKHLMSMLRSFNEMNGLDYTALRFFNIFGTRMDTDGKYTEVLIKWYKCIKEGQQPLIYGDGKQTMDFVYIEDIARSCICAMVANTPDSVYNIGSGEEISLEELCFALLKAMGSNLQPKYIDIPDERKKVEVLKRKADIQAAKKDIQFETTISLDAGLKRLVDWLDTIYETNVIETI